MFARWLRRVKPPILVCGGTGTVGREVVGLLRASGWRVRVPSRRGAGARSLLADGTEIVAGELSDAVRMREALRDVGWALLPSALDPPGFAITKAFLAAARECGLSWLVNLSGLSAASGKPTIASGWHAEADRLVEESGIPFVHLRPTAFLQNNLDFAEDVSERGVLPDPFGGNAIPCIDARDVAVAAAELLTSPGRHGGGAVKLTGPALVTQGDLAGMLSKELGREIRAEAVAPPAMRDRLLAKGIAAIYAEVMEDVYTKYASSRFATTADFKELVGRAPRGAADFVRDYRASFLR